MDIVTHQGVVGVDDKVDDLSVLSSPLQSLPVLIAWGRCVRFVEFPNLFTPDHCLREAGAGSSNLLTPTIFTSCFIGLQQSFQTAFRICPSLTH